MDDEKKFFDQLGVLAQFPSASSRERALQAVFASIKALVGPDRWDAVTALFPGWLKTKCAKICVAHENVQTRDVVELVKIFGEYSYRGAADLAIKGVMGSLAEVFDQHGKEQFRKALPVEMVHFWEDAQSCSLAATIGQHL